MRIIPTLIAAVSITILATAIGGDVGKEMPSYVVESDSVWLVVLFPATFFLLGFIANKNDE